MRQDSYPPLHVFVSSYGVSIGESFLASYIPSDFTGDDWMIAFNTCYTYQ